MRKMWVVIRREFVERVRTKWFIISTVLGPLLMVAFVAVPLIMARKGAQERVIGVIDATSTEFGRRLAASLDRAPPIKASWLPTPVAEIEQAADSLAVLIGAKVVDGFMIVSDEAVDDGKLEYRGSNVSSPRDMQILSTLVEEAVFTERLGRAGVDAALVRQAKIPLQLRTLKVAGARTTASSGEGSFILAYVIWLLLYMGILLYGVNVMGSVVEEKTSRIVEVLISSLKPFQLLAGKIIGVGGVGLFQFAIWGLCGAVLIDRRELVFRLLGESVPGGSTAAFPEVPLATVAVFLLYFLLGYFLYAAMFAAVGAMTSSEAEARQAANFVVMLLVLPSVLMIGILNDPDGTMAIALSIVPFTSPIAMPVRWAAAEVPATEIMSSLGALAAALLAVTWVASRIYRVGILAYGKRPGLRDLVRWVRTA
ncbi:MAG TPA: ABC transporter permease [Gemmatimonadales bacterium]